MAIATSRMAGAFAAAKKRAKNGEKSPFFWFFLLLFLSFCYIFPVAKSASQLYNFSQERLCVL